MIIPAGHKVMIKPKEVAKYSGAIELVIDEDRERAATTEGEIVGIGETAYMKVDDGRPWVKIGDKVLYAKYAGVLAVDPDDGVQYVVVHDIDIVCKIVDTKGD